MNLKCAANSARDIVARGTPVPRATQGAGNNLIEFLVNTLIEIREAQCIARDLVADIDVITTGC
jgi:hypothetical protein